MNLSSISIKHFKMIADVNLPLSTTTILVGANGSGKSSILQALHLACCVTRQAERVEQSKPNTVSISEVDYLPTNDYKTLGHKTPWGNRKESPCTLVGFRFDTAAESIAAEIKIRSARNNGISITATLPPSVQPMFRKHDSFFSCYVPGLSGIPNSEKRKAKELS